MSKVLIISNAAMCLTDSNGRSITRLLDCIGKENKAQFYVYGKPDENECSSFYHVSDSAALNSFTKRKRIDGTYCGNDSNNLSQSNKRISKTPLKMLLREFVWKHGTWNNKYLHNWIDEFNPSCIFVVAGDNWFTLDLARKLAKEKKIPIVLYSTEEYPFKDYNYVTKRASLFYLIWIKKLRKAYSKIAKFVEVGVLNTEDLALMYEKEYGYKTVPIYQSSNIDWIENFSVKQEPIISYLGNLGLNRHKVLIKIANALEKIQPGLKLHVYGNPNENVKKELESNGNIILEGFIPYEKVVEVIHRSSLLVHGEFEDKFYTRDLKYAFSTKITDSVCSGTPFFVYAPKELVGTSFLLKNKCSFVATCQEELEPFLKQALFDENRRKEVLQNAYLVRGKCFTNNGLMKKIIEEIVNENCSN